jgi:FkbM family methyltransferase
MRDDAGLDVVRWGLRMRLHPKRNGTEKRVLFTPQLFDAPERDQLAKRLAKTNGRPFVFVDVGANVGMYSMFVASCAGRGARILAFEPEHENLRRLRFNIDANPGLPIRVLAHALGDAERSVMIVPNTEDRGGTRTRLPQQDEVADDALRVECKTLAQALSQEGVTSIDALKIDVEGAEDLILAPFFATTPESLWPRLVIIEDCHFLWRTDLYGEMRARGYREVDRTRMNVMMER